MKKALLLHNPSAGEETHDEAELTSLLKDAGYESEYRSLKASGWKKGMSDADLLVIAGGDGSVRKVATVLLDKKSKEPPPIGVLPFGTANNISRTVNTEQEIAAIAQGWSKGKIRPFDIGWIKGLSKKHFFIEGVGFGVFPALVSVMKLVDRALNDEPEKRIDTALGLLAGILRSYQPKQCSLTIDGRDYSGNYLLVEVMNICSIGPNLALASDCEPGDGKFHIVMVPENGRDQFLTYISSRIKGQEPPASFPSITGSDIRLKTAERKLHIDDELIKTAGNVELEISLDRGRLQFLA